METASNINQAFNKWTVNKCSLNIDLEKFWNKSESFEDEVSQGYCVLCQLKANIQADTLKISLEVADHSRICLIFTLNQNSLVSWVL